MSKERVQVSKDRGRTWKYRWVDRFELDPKKSVLEPGDWMRRGPEHGKIVVVCLKDGKLCTKLLESLYEYTYALASGESYVFLAESSQEADLLFVDELLRLQKIVRKSSRLKPKE